ncbi:murein L,D-transpeptidase catalytic domain-containing protein [Flavobacterium sp. RHBU_3]|uniref:murein L,D-transpeptidase catalytic domain-containing protein n=1 Tax=Flavobacterium sp. RHBU_3 TaxID=3391184 RepID=UPI003984911E
MFRLTLLFCTILLACGNASEPKETVIATKDYSQKHNEALAYCKANGFSTEYYFLVDLNVHSGRNRFFVYDFTQKKITAQNLVTHGACDAFEQNSSMYEKVKFSNRVDSHCSSSGKYKVGSRDYSSWGINVKYWLEGLEESNNNVRDRVIVLHSWEAVQDTEIYPNYSPLSWGCPAVSNNFMRTLDTKLKATKKPVLLWIVE